MSASYVCIQSLLESECRGNKKELVVIKSAMLYRVLVVSLCLLGVLSASVINQLSVLILPILLLRTRPLQIVVCRCRTVQGH